MTGAAQPRQERLRREFLEALPGRIEALLSALAELRSSPEAVEPRSRARQLAHQLHGAAGSHGHPALGDAAGALEAALAQAGEPGVLAAVAHAQRLQAAVAALEQPAGGDSAAPPLASSAPRLLVIGTDGALVRALAELARAHLWEVLVAPTAAEALEAASRLEPDAAIVDLGCGDFEEALALVAALRALPDGMTVAAAVESATLATRVLAARAGASICLDKGADAQAMALQLETLFAERRALREEVVVLVVHERPGPVVAQLAPLDLTVYAAEPAGLLEAIEQRRPDALVLGERLGALTGGDGCRALRTSLRYRDLPIVMLAGQLSAALQAEAADAGADAEMAEPFSAQALAARLRALVMKTRVSRERADTDALTGLLLRRPFLGRLSARLAEARRRSAPLAVCLLDLDAFKSLNTRLGHFGADRLLAAFARVLQTTFRLEDLSCRWGGDEFAVAFPGQTAEQGLLALRRMEPRARAVTLDGVAEPVAFSAGVAAFPQDGAEGAELLRVADARLFDAKAAGRGRALST